MAHIRDHKIAKLIMQHAANFVTFEAQLPVTIVDAQLIDKRTLHLFYQLSAPSDPQPEAIEAVHKLLVASIPKLRHYIAQQTILKAIPTVYFKYSV